MNIGQSILLIRKHKNLSQKEFSKLIEIDQSYLSLIENNKKNPSMNILEKVSIMTDTPLPVILFFALTEEDVPQEKRELYQIIFPRLKEIIVDIFGIKVDRNDW